MPEKLTAAEKIDLFNAAPDDALFTWDVIELITGRPKTTEDKARVTGDCIPFVRDGRRVKNRKKDVLHWLANRRVQKSTSENAKPYFYTKRPGRPRTDKLTLEAE